METFFLKISFSKIKKKFQISEKILIFFPRATPGPYANLIYNSEDIVVILGLKLINSYIFSCSRNVQIPSIEKPQF